MKKIKKIIIGTHNQGKFKEISNLLPSYIKKISPKKLNLSSPEETGSSFRENSKLKAQFFSKKTNLICISDDSGLEIDLLSGAPGIYSSRWAGSNNDFNLDKYNKPKQFFPKTYLPNGYIDIVKTSNIIKNQFHGKKVLPYIVDEFNSDIDNKEDYNYVKFKLGEKDEEK